jgi:hypothetical protein
VGGKPKMVSERYLGTAADIVAAVEAREASSLPERIRHRGFGDTVAVWGMLRRLDAAGLVDEVSGTRPAGLALSTGVYLELVALNRVVARCSTLAFAEWWKTTAAERFTKIPASALDHRRFWGGDARRDHRGAGGDLWVDRGADGGGVRAGVLLGGAGVDHLRHLQLTPVTPRRRSRSGVKPHRNAPTCGSSGWDWCSPATVGSR